MRVLHVVYCAARGVQTRPAPRTSLNKMEQAMYPTCFSAYLRSTQCKPICPCHVTH